MAKRREIDGFVKEVIHLIFSRRTKICIGFFTVLLTTACAHISPPNENDFIRTAGTNLDDRTLERYMRREIIALGDQRPLRIKVMVYDGVVLFVGDAETKYPSSHLREQAGRLRAVKRVFDRISVENPLRNHSPFEDLLLAGRVRFALVALEELDNAEIEYLVDKKRIYLMGTVTTSQADIVIKRMSALKGVDAVVVAFEFVGDTG